MKTYHDGDIARPTYALIDRERFGRNIEKARKLSHSDIIAVVKADAYGHGAGPLAEYAFKEKDVRRFAVATMGEALALRKYLPKKADVIVLGYITETYISEAIEEGLTLPVFDDKYARDISKTAKNLGKNAKVALEIDTGMSRLGFSHNLNLGDFSGKYPNLSIDYAISHLATSDSDNGFACEQTEKFDRFLEINKDRSFATSFLNSSGIANFENRWNYTRPGLMLYGYESTGTAGNLEPVMSVWSEITHVKKIKKGDSVGYGRTYFAERDMLVGVVPIGYADGYLRSFSNKGYMMAGDVKCPVVGSVCMDMTMIDVTSLGSDARNRKVEVMGDNITADIWARWGNSISYEMLCGVSYRVPRIYKSW